MNKFGTENAGMFDMSPLNSKQSDGSLSFNETSRTVKAPAPGGSAMSTDSVSRAPFGEIQSNAFEFKPVGQPAKPATGPFSTRMAPAESQAENAMTPQQNRLEAKTPGTSGTVVSQLRDVKPAEREAEPATPLVWSELLLWTEPLQTLVVFVGGLVAFGLFTWVAYGAHNWSLLSTAAYLLLLDLGINFVRYFVSEPWHKRCLWTGSKQLNDLRAAVDSFLLYLGSAHDKYLSAEDPTITLKVAGVLWALAWVGSYVSMWWFVLLSYIAVFTVPCIYSMTKDQINNLATSVRAKTLDQVDKAGLPRTVRWSISAAIMVSMIWLSSFSTALIGTFVICTYWRTLMFTREIAAVRNFAEPYTQSVHKVSSRIGAAAEDAFQRLSTAGPAKRTKSHFRAE